MNIISGPKHSFRSSIITPYFALLSKYVNYGEGGLQKGGGLQNGRGGACEVLPLQKGGAEKVLAMLKGAHKVLG